MEFLLPLYINADSDSPLLASTSATALACFSKTPGRKMLMSQARKMYVSAVALTQKAISDPVEVKSDVTLMAVMLLGLFESFTANEDTSESWGHHTDGAVAIVKHRGKEMLSNPVSAKLFCDVRTQMIIGQVARCKPVEQIFYEFNDWKILPEDDCLGFANRLTIITMQVPALRATAIRILRGPMNWTIAREIVTLKEDAERVDRELAAWSLEVPDLWKFRELDRFERTDDPNTAEFHPGPIHCYNDIWTARKWNIYRSYRILCQAIILNCLERLIPTSTIASTDEYRRTAAISRSMVDDICASVPFHLGFPAPMYDIEYKASPNNLKDYSRDDHDLPKNKYFHTARYKDAQALGGYYLIWELLVAANVIIIDGAQRDWIMNRLRHIGAKYGLNQATMLAAQRLQRLGDNRSVSLVDFAPPHDAVWEHTGGRHWREFLSHEEGY
ncbi:hypothetical protein MMC30_007516 [Trapelia coarctata]|nr:hypothetical protein [Trapelia coarctata]